MINSNHGIPPEEGEADDGADGRMFIDPPNPYGSIKSFRRFVRDTDRVRTKEPSSVSVLRTIAAALALSTAACAGPSVAANGMPYEWCMTQYEIITEIGDLKSIGYSIGHASNDVYDNHRWVLRDGVDWPTITYFANMVYGTNEIPFVLGSNIMRACEAQVERGN